MTGEPRQELCDEALGAVGREAIGWLMIDPSKGGAEVAFYDADTAAVRGASRTEIATLLRARWPNDPQTQTAIDEMNATPLRRWIVATKGDAFVWFWTAGTPVYRN